MKTSISIIFLFFLIFTNCNNQSDYEFYKNTSFNPYNARLPLVRPYEMIGTIGPEGKINSWLLLEVEGEKQYNEIDDVFFSKVTIVNNNTVILAQPDDCRWVIIDTKHKSKYYFSRKHDYDSTLAIWNMKNVHLMDIDSVYSIYKKIEKLPDCWPKFTDSEPFF